MLHEARIGQFFIPTLAHSASPDEDDNRFLELAEAADAHYLVTGNKRHFPRHSKQTRVVNARELLTLLAAAWEL
jgi:predicted nucleic acid-binding protein